MSGKKEGTSNSVLFTIDLDNFEDGRVPAVSVLLNPSKIAEAAAKKAVENEKQVQAERVEMAKKQSIPAKPEVTSSFASIKLEPLNSPSSNSYAQTSAPTPLFPDPAPVASKASAPMQNLTEMGVGFELIFKKESSGFHFHTAKAHQKGALPPWQSELFTKMKWDPAVFSLRSDFHEFDSRSSIFALDAFGAPENAWIQMIQLSPQAWTILISSQSLVKQKDHVVALLKGESAVDKSGLIELDLAS